MDQGTMIAIVVGVLVLAVVGWLVWQRQRSGSCGRAMDPSTTAR